MVDLSEQQRELQRMRSEALSDLILGKGRATQDYRQYTNILNQNLASDRKDVRDSAASRGLFGSGIQQGQENELVQNYLNNVQSGNTTLQRQIEDLTRQSQRSQNRGYSGLEAALFQTTGAGISNLLNQALNQAKSNVFLRR